MTKNKRKEIITDLLTKKFEKVVEQVNRTVPEDEECFEEIRTVGINVNMGAYISGMNDTLNSDLCDDDVNMKVAAGMLGGVVLGLSIKPVSNKVSRKLRERKNRAVIIELRKEARKSMGHKSVKEQKEILKKAMSRLDEKDMELYGQYAGLGPFEKEGPMKLPEFAKKNEFTTVQEASKKIKEIESALREEIKKAMKSEK